ncbi:MAG: MerR family transcriptional regulator [Mycobacterium sp.]
MWKVGALAELTGLTVRALHHYDHIGLLKPSHRSPSGHRLYTGDDVVRLYRVCLLRRLGFGLSRIGGIVNTCGSRCFRRPPFRLIRHRVLRV